VDLLADAVRRALGAVPLTDADQAAAELAITYATQVDSGETELAKAGTGLLAVLEALGMTPRARKSLVKGAADGPTSPLDELRQRRRQRAAPAVDAAAS